MGARAVRSRRRTRGIADDGQQRHPCDRAVERSDRPDRARRAGDLGRPRHRNRVGAGAAPAGTDPGGRMTPDIREGDRTAAFDAALVAYRPDSHYVPPLWSDFVRFREEPLHHRRPRRYALFSALRDGRPVGRIAASIHDDSNRKHGTYNGAFGFFDCIDDADVADALLGKAEGWQPIKRSGFKVRLEDARIILNDGFADNPMFVPPTAAEYLFQAGDMMWIIDKRISTVVYHRGRPAGAIIAIPDLNPLVKSSGGKVGLIAPLRFLQHRTRNNRAVLIYQSVCRELH